MRYLTRDDLIDGSYEQFIIDSTSDWTGVIPSVEAKAIALVSTYLTKYDVDTIFGIPMEDTDGYTPGIRHELLADILTKITLYKIFRRNAARKIPQDIKEDYDWAIKQLESIRNGSVVLDDLPPAINEDGSSTSNSMWGNNTNTDYYI